MSRIAATFAALNAQGRRALIPYVTAGFPYADITPALMHGMVAAGADVIELGVPFSDPSADGPVIQKAGGDIGNQGLAALCLEGGKGGCNATHGLAPFTTWPRIEGRS